MEEGLIGGEDLIANPPAGFERRRQRVRPKQGLGDMSETVIETSKLTKEFVARRISRGGAEGRGHPDSQRRVRRADGTVRLGKIDPVAPDRGHGPSSVEKFGCSAKTCGL